MKRPSQFSALVLIGVTLSCLSAFTSNAAQIVDFNRDIRPIFSETCYACHGPDQNKRKAGLRFDHQEEPFKVLESGKTAVVPGDLAKSELIRRITTSDPEDHMPPPDSL